MIWPFNRKKAAEPAPEKTATVETEAPAKRSFSAAQVSRLTASWTTQPKPLDEDIKAGLRKLRARSREQSLNNDYVRRFLQVTRSNVIGPQGIQLQGRIIDPAGTPDDRANQAVEEAWREFGDVCDVTGKLDWRGVQSLFADIAPVDGEVLIRIVRNWPHNRFGIALEFLDAEALDADLNHDYGDGRRIVMGVELDRWRRPVAYHLISKNGQIQYGSKKYTRVPAADIIHAYLPVSAWQTRGFPWIAVSLMRLNMLNGYEESELVAARTAAAKMGFFTMNPEMAASMDMAGTKDADGNLVTEADPGTFELLPPGYEFKPWDPNHPNAAFKDFVKANLRGIAAGLGVSYHTLANDLEGVNYSSGRLGALEDREAWKALQEWVIRSLCKPVFEAWLESSLLRGQITVAGNPLKASRRDKYRRVSWQPRRWAWVDPQKDMTAAIAAVNARVRSISDVIRERGQDPEEVWQEIARERKRMEELGIAPADVAVALTGGNDDAS